MKQIHKNNLKQIFKPAFGMIGYLILGAIILPVAVFFREKFICQNVASRPAEKFKWKWVNKIYGNDVDGFADVYYRREFPTDSWWSRYKWSAFRNSIHNYKIDIGVNDIVVKSVIHGNQDVTDDPFEKNLGLKFQEVWTRSGNYYPMYYYCQLWRNIIPFYKGDKGIRILLGWKNFCVNNGEGKFYSYGMTISPNIFKQFVKG